MPDDPILSGGLVPRASRESSVDKIRRVAQSDNISDDIAEDFVKVTGLESGRSHYSRGGQVKVSPIDPKDGQRAIGFSQIKPATARSVGITDPYDEESNIKAGLRYYAQGGSDPVRRRIAYFSGQGSRAVKYYDRTGQIPKGADQTGTTFQQYIAGTGGNRIAAAARTLQPQVPILEGGLVPKQPRVETSPNPVPVNARGVGMARAVQSPAVPTRGVLHAAQRRGWGRGNIGDGIMGGNVEIESRGGNLRQLDDPETSRILRVQRQVTTEQTPAERQMQRAPGTADARLLDPKLTENEEVLRRVAEEKAREADLAKQTAWEQTNRAAIDSHVAQYRKQIRDAGFAKWLTETQAKGASSLLEFGAGASGTVGATETANALRVRAVAAMQAAQEEGAGRTEASKFVQDVLGGFAGSAPELLLMQAGVPPIATFGAGSGLRAKGMGRPVAPAVVQGMGTGAAFEMPTGGPGVRGALSKAGKVGLATAGVDLATGQPVEQALKSGATNAFMVAAPGVVEGRGNAKVETQPNVETQPPTIERDGPVREVLRSQISTETPVASGVVERLEGQPPPIPPIPPVVRHVDLQPRRVRGEGKGQFKSETRAQAEERRAQVDPPTTPDAGTTTPKEPWQVTRLEYQTFANDKARDQLAKSGLDYRAKPQDEQTASIVHKASVYQAVAEGEPVPPEVLADYPNLAEQRLAGVKPEITEAKSPVEPSTTSARKSQMTEDRTALDLPELPPAERKSWQTSLNNAKPEKATVLADEVLTKPRALNDEETASLVVRAQQIKNEYSQVMKEIGDATDPEDISAKRSQAEALEREFDKITTATKASGTEKGRALASQKLTINQDYDLVSMVQRAKAAKGRELAPEERTKYESMAKQIEDLNSQLADAHEKIKAKSIQNQIDKVARQRKRSETKEVLDDEFAALRAQFAKAKLETRSGVQSAGLAGLDPEGKLTPLIAKMARNRVKAGVVTAEGIVDEIYRAVKEHIEGVSKRDIRDAISGYGMEPKSDQRSDHAKQLASIRSELKKLSTQEDVDAEKILSRRDKVRQSQLLKQESELQRRLEQQDFSPRAKPEPIVYSRETYVLTKKLEGIKQTYNNELYKATRGTRGRIYDEVAKFGNLPKTLKSMADISAVFRQGGFYAISHPVEGLIKPSQDMLKSFSDMGYRNVESAIKSHSKFDLAKRSGVEFTGIDKNDPNLAHKEEGYLGTDALGTISRGKYNPLRIVKGTADFSERTFVSFLDSQRMHIFDQMTKGLESQGITYRNSPEAYKAAAKLINAGTGRGNLGVRGNQAAPLLNLAMFSPRLVASRVQLLNNMFNPVTMARMPRGARSIMIKDNVKFLAATAVVIGVAKAMGGTVSLDPDDGDFLKIRFGSTTYDTLTGLQQPLRAIINMGRAVKADVTKDDLYSGNSKSEIASRFARSKLAPLAGAGVDYLTGTDFNGRPFSATREAKDLLTPLPASDFVEAMKKEGLIKGFAKALPTVTGIGVQTYDASQEKATTQAEKLARKFVRDAMPDKARTDEEIDKSKQVSDLRARSRQGQDVSAEIKTLGLTDRQRKAIVEAKGQTRLQEDVKHLSLEDAIRVYRASNRGEQQQIRDLLVEKAEKVDEMDRDRQSQVKAQMAAIGMKPGAAPPRKPREPRSPRTASQHYAFQ